ncbi:MAG: phosphohydrolase [Deltaproteobacteria bacterium SG8_13]|nr:MAG: phosphohydrolase [Deltaproteobacteria bacterium SG8_13]
MERSEFTPQDPQLKKIAQELLKQQLGALSARATLNSSAVRRRREEQLENDYRQPYSVDTDRILHSLAYTRYIDKTQVFYLIENDHITHRVLHVQLVSKIARTIGRFLRLNEDLIEAIALGHDIGHIPFGHDGEKILTRLCRAHGIGSFHHNLQSVQFLDRVEKKGRGWNLCLQTLDGILCHDGEIHNQQLAPNTGKTFSDLDDDIAAKKEDPDIELTPMTMEGCVVRMTDTISYIGRDIEDAIRLGLIDRSDLPGPCVRILGSTNGTIVYNLVSDVIKNSYRQPFVAFSAGVSDALRLLKEFNLQRIYMNPKIKQHLGMIQRLFEILFDQFLTELVSENRSSAIFTQFLKDMSPDYIDRHRPEEIVRDFIAGMTDQYFLRQCPEELRPSTVGR